MGGKRRYPKSGSEGGRYPQISVATKGSAKAARRRGHRSAPAQKLRGSRASNYFTIALAAASWLLEVDKMPEMLPPTPKQRAAVAKATKASSRVYSIRS